MRHRLLPLVLLALAACESASSPPPPQVVTFPDLDAWSGGTLLAITSWSATQSLPVVLVDGDTAHVHAVDDSTVAIVMPQGNRSVPVVWSHDGSADSVHAVLHGFVARAYGPVASGLPLPLAGSAWPQFLANGESTLVRIDARTMSASPYARSLHNVMGCMLGPGPTYDDASFLLMTDCTWLRITQLGAVPAVVDSLSSNGTALVAGQPSHDVYLYHTRQYRALTIVGPSAPALSTDLPDQVYGFRISPRGDRTLPLGDQWMNDVPVIDSRTGAIAYRIAHVKATYGAAFSTAGDTLFLVDGYRDGVLVADASTGDSLAWVALDTAGGSPWELALDPAGRWIYVELATGVAVIERTRLELAAVLRWPSGQGCSGPSTFLFSAEQPALYLAMTGSTFWSAVSRVCALSFSTVPPT